MNTSTQFAGIHTDELDDRPACFFPALEDKGTSLWSSALSVDQLVICRALAVPLRLLWQRVLDLFVGPCLASGEVGTKVARACRR